jgi:hypothetical protein
MDAAIPITVEWMDSKHQMHAYSYSVHALPRKGDHVAINNEYFVVLAAVFRLDRETITILTERTK